MQGGYIYRTPEQKARQKEEASYNRMLNIIFFVFYLAIIVMLVISTPHGHYIELILWIILITISLTMVASTTKL